MPCTSGAPTTITGSRSVDAADDLGDPPRRPSSTVSWRNRSSMASSRSGSAPGRPPPRRPSSWQRSGLLEDGAARWRRDRRSRPGSCTPRPGRTRGRRPSRSPRRRVFHDGDDEFPPRVGSAPTTTSRLGQLAEGARDVPDQPVPVVRRQPRGGDGVLREDLPELVHRQHLALRRGRARGAGHGDGRATGRSTAWPSAASTAARRTRTSPRRSRSASPARTSPRSTTTGTTWSPAAARSQCAWLKDRFGLSWQIVPTRLNELMSDPNPARAKRRRRPCWACRRS